MRKNTVTGKIDSLFRCYRSSGNHSVCSLLLQQALHFSARLGNMEKKILDYKPIVLHLYQKIWIVNVRQSICFNLWYGYNLPFQEPISENGFLHDPLLARVKT